MSETHSVVLAPGELIENRYLVLERIGLGSIAFVYKCRDHDLRDRVVALKVLFPHEAVNKETVELFRQQVVSSYLINNCNVIRTFEFLHRGKLAALAMEYVAGGNLSQFLKREKRLKIDKAVDFLLQLCCGLHALHEIGIGHRDLKPTDILIAEGGVVKIGDFSMPRGSVVTNTSGRLKHSASPYASPEYLHSGRHDARSDIFSLGVLAYEMISGSLPQCIAEIQQSSAMCIEPLSRQREDCPEDLSIIVAKALQRDPNRRFQSAGEFYRALKAIRLSADSSPTSGGEKATQKDKVSDETENPKLDSAPGSLGIDCERGKSENNGASAKQHYGQEMCGEPLGTALLL